ncbi:hypothetical protein FXE52_10770 [Vibrio cholerae]|nr:hypothetical protein FXE52_10770 [Vibrio cholerae]
MKIYPSFLLMPNARLRGWQRINTKLKHNNHNPRGSLGLETPRVDSPFEAFVSFVAYYFAITFKRLFLNAILRKSIKQAHAQRQKL